MIDKKTKRGRGRPSGANSFVYLPLEELQKIFGSKAKVAVSKKQLEALGFDCSTLDKSSQKEYIQSHVDASEEDDGDNDLSFAKNDFDD